MWGNTLSFKGPSTALGKDSHLSPIQPLTRCRKQCRLSSKARSHLSSLLSQQLSASFLRGLASKMDPKYAIRYTTASTGAVARRASLIEGGPLEFSADHYLVPSSAGALFCRPAGYQIGYPAYARVCFSPSHQYLGWSYPFPKHGLVPLSRKSLSLSPGGGRRGAFGLVGFQAAIGGRFARSHACSGIKDD